MLHEKYGFNNFKLKGGVLRGEEEMEALRAIKKAFPEARINVTPTARLEPGGGHPPVQGHARCDHSVWRIPAALECVGYSRPRDHAGIQERRPVPGGHQHDRHRLAAKFYHTISLNACDIILADPHFRGASTAPSAWPSCWRKWGLTPGRALQQPFRHPTLAAFARSGCGSARRARPAGHPLDLAGCGQKPAAGYPADRERQAAGAGCSEAWACT
ncbi:MAG: hypothetical protein ACLU9S_03660 [Oscillospiraceae bacterium]